MIGVIIEQYGARVGTHNCIRIKKYSTYLEGNFRHNVDVYILAASLARQAIVPYCATTIIKASHCATAIIKIIFSEIKTIPSETINKI